MSRIGFTARLRHGHATDLRQDSERLEVEFEVSVYPAVEPRWLMPLFDEVAVLAREIRPSVADLDSLYGRIQLRWNGEIHPGFKMPLTFNTTRADVQRVAEQLRSDENAAKLALAQAAWDRYYSPQARKLVIRELVRQELK